MINEFKTFVLRGNMIDLAVGVLIGVAFGQVIASLVANILTPVSYTHLTLPTTPYV